jgi:hypothetical protein
MKLQFSVTKILDVGADASTVDQLRAELWANGMVEYEDQLEGKWKEHLYSTSRETYEHLGGKLSVGSGLVLEKILTRCEKFGYAYFRIIF